MSTTYTALLVQSFYCFYPYIIPSNQINKSKISFATLVLSSSPANCTVSVINMHNIGCMVILGFMLLKASGFVLEFRSQYFVLVTLLHNYRTTAGVSSVF